jgi:acyl-coenzyme A thioesterase PaaI-like protein
MVHPAEQFFSIEHPLSGYVAIKVEDADEQKLSVSLTAPQCFVGDARTGMIHSSLATLVLDSVMGGAVMGALGRMQPIATVGLTVQHLRRPLSGEQLRCQVWLSGIESEMAHVAGELHSAAERKILSTATGIFMIGTRSVPLGVRV